jgi:hypothetical protein
MARNTIDWQARITRPNEPAVPIFISGMRRTFWVPPRYYRLVARVQDGRPFTQRAMAASLGYSTMGLHDALQQMARLGFGVLTSTRGWAGRTRFRLQADVTARCANVRTTERPSNDLEREDRQAPTVVRTLTHGGSPLPVVDS